jgi:hypothetical protein
MMIVFIALTVLIVAWALRVFGLGWQSDSQERNTPLDTLKHLCVQTSDGEVHPGWRVKS